MATIVVAAAVVERNGCVLVTRRLPDTHLAGHWEFPGGKCQPGESLDACMRRELKEELAIDVTEACLAPFTFASHRYETFHLLMPLYVCRKWEGIVAPQEGQRMKWIPPKQLADYPMPPADKPLVAMIRDFL